MKLMSHDTISDIVARVRVDKPEKFKLGDADPRDKLCLDFGKDEAKDVLAAMVKEISRQQERLYAEGRTAVLALFQAMDAGGKDSAIAHVFSGVNPQGVQVTSFKQPSAEELAHDFLWRTTKALPPRGLIGVFNRSYYEEVLVVRVHPALLAKQGIAADKIDGDFWDARYRSISDLEQHLAQNGTTVLKFHLRISKDEQRQRFLDRLNEPDKLWKFSLGDLPERAQWDTYMDAYQAMIRGTSTKHAPWHVIPADHKWVARIAVAAVMLDALHRIAPHAPEVSAAQRAEFETAKRELEGEDPKEK